MPRAVGTAIRTKEGTIVNDEITFDVYYDYG
jgi:hypothetical protein